MIFAAAAMRPFTLRVQCTQKSEIKEPENCQKNQSKHIWHSPCELGALRRPRGPQGANRGKLRGGSVAALRIATEAKEEQEQREKHDVSRKR